MHLRLTLNGRLLGIGCLLLGVACGDSSDDANGSPLLEPPANRTRSADDSSLPSAGTGALGSSAPIGPSGNIGAAGSGGANLGPAGGAGTGANTNISLGGAQDFGYFRSLLAAGTVPRIGDFDAAGFFAEHHTALPEPDCGQRVCLQTMLAVLGNLMNGQNCTMLQLGLNSPIAADPSNRPPLDLAVVVDVSGSMNDAGKIDFVRQGLELLIDGMRDTDRLAMVTYSDGAELVFPLQEVALERAELREIARGLIAEGSTNLYAGLQLGYQEITGNYDSARQNRLILLSDGVPTIGITGDQQIMDMSRGYNSDGIGLTTVGLGNDFNGALMRGLAEQGDGNTYFLENAGAVSEVFEEELSYFTVPVAFDLKLELSAGTHYQFRRALGSSFWLNTPGAAGGILEVPSVFLAHRESDQDVTDEGGRRGGGSALMIELMPRPTEAEDVTDAIVAGIDVSFREPGSDQIIEDHVDVHFPMSPWRTPERGFFDSPDLVIIQKSFVMLNIYVAFEEASTLFYDDQPAEARAMLERVIAAVEDYNEEMQDLDIEYDLQMLADMRDLIARNGIELPTDFTVPQNPWPVDD